jgi:hypothetical protein
MALSIALGSQVSAPPRRIAWAAQPDRAAAGAVNRQPNWRTPTSGSPLALRYLPPESRAVVCWRVSQFLAHPEADRILQALGELGVWCRQTLPLLAGAPLSDIERVDIGLLPADEGPPPLSLVIYRTNAIDPRRAGEAWRRLPQKTIAGKTVYADADRAYYLPAELHARVLAVIPIGFVEPVVTQGSEPLAWERELEELRSASDDARLFNLIAKTNYWTAGGKGLLGDSVEPVRDWLSWLFGRHAPAFLLSLHLDQNLFFELRTACSADERPAGFARGFMGRWQELSKRAKEQIASRGLTDYNRRVLERYPKMLEVLAAQSRWELQGRHLLLRAYLPAVAAHNLALGTRLFFEPPRAATGGGP